MDIKILNFNFNKENLESEIKVQTEDVVLVLDINYNDLELIDEDKSPFCNIESKFKKYNYLLSLKSDTCQVQETEKFKNLISFLKKFQKFNYKYLGEVNPMDYDTLFHGSPYDSFVSENQNFGFWED